MAVERRFLRRTPAFDKCAEANVLDIYECGRSCADIAKVIGVGRQTVNDFISLMGGRVRSKMEAARRSSRHGHLKGKKRPCIARPLGSKRTTNKGYLEIKTSDGWVREHRHIMEIFIGRSLRGDEVVHHKDGDKKNNKINNLEILNHGEHTRIHHLGVKRSLETRRKISCAKKRGGVE